MNIENLLMILDPVADRSRPQRCVYMSSLAETLDGQTWIDMDCLEHVCIYCILVLNDKRMFQVLAN